MSVECNVTKNDKNARPHDHSKNGEGEGQHQIIALKMAKHSLKTVMKMNINIE